MVPELWYLNYWEWGFSVIPIHWDWAFPIAYCSEYSEYSVVVALFNSCGFVQKPWLCKVVVALYSSCGFVQQLWLCLIVAMFIG